MVRHMQQWYFWTIFFPFSLNGQIFSTFLGNEVFFAVVRIKIEPSQFWTFCLLVCNLFHPYEYFGLGELQAGCLREASIALGKPSWANSGCLCKVFSEQCLGDVLSVLQQDFVISNNIWIKGIFFKLNTEHTKILMFFF